MKKIVKNSIKCKKCNDIIESRYEHDLQYCKCGSVSVDGGTLYQRVSWPNGEKEEDYIDFKYSIYAS